MRDHSTGLQQGNSDRDWQLAVDRLVQKHPLLFKGIFPLATAALALGFSIVLSHYSDAPVMVVFILAVILTAWIAGPVAGFTSLVLGFIGAFYTLPAFAKAPGVFEPGQLVRVVSNFVVGVLLILIIWRLRIAEERNRRMTSIVNSSDDAIIGKNLDGIITSWNRGAERLYGYSPEEVIGKPISILLAPEIPDELAAILQKVTAGERIELYETVRRRKDGTRVHVALKVSPIRDASGEVIGASSIAHDITERKLEEEKRRRSEQLLSEAEKLSHTGAWDWDLLADRFTFSEEWATIHGLKNKTLRPDELLMIAHPGDREAISAAFAKVRSGTAPYEMEHRILRQDTGEVRTVRARGRSVRNTGGEVVRIYGFVQDITEQRRAENEAKEREEHARRIIDNMLALVGVMTPDGTAIEANAAALAAGGLTREEVIGRKFWDCYWWNHDPELQAQLREAVAKAASGEVVRYDVTVRTANNGRMIVDFMLAPVRNRAGEITYLIPSGIEITERKRAEELLLRSEQRLRRFYESGMVGVIYWNMDGEITEANDKFLSMVGYTRAELEAGLVNWAAMTPPEFAASDEFALKELRETGVDTPYEKEYIRKDGTRVPVVLGAAMLDDARHDGVAFVLDNSERKRAERALIRSEKLASAGRMAATVAHEINNPLEIITNSVYIALRDDNLSVRGREILSIAEQELLRVAQLTRQTLGFYRETTSPTKLDASALISEVLHLYQPKFAQRGIEVCARLNRNMELTAIGGEIRQLVTNILANSIDACPNGGKLFVRTSRLTVNDISCIRLTFADTGEGILKENLRHIFEPFFTTKEAFGTGLGLWVSNEIVKRHHGSIRVRSLAGKGTVFSVLLPSAEAEGQSASAAVDSITP